MLCMADQVTWLKGMFSPGSSTTWLAPSTNSGTKVAVMFTSTSMS